MNEILYTLSKLSLLVFVISVMTGTGLTLKIHQITDSLKNVKRVILALAINFIIIPGVAYLITLLLPLDESVRIGLILLATAAGAPFLPKLTKLAEGDVAFSVGLMVLLMVATIIYLPLVLPLLLRGVEVNPWDIAQSLILLMLLPLAVGLFLNGRYEEFAAKLQPTLAQASDTALLFLLVLALVLNFKGMISLVGSFGILAAVIFILSCIAIGYLLGGSDTKTRTVMALGAGERNKTAALVVAGQSFSGDVITFILVFSLLMMIILVPLAGELGRRHKKKG